ncbi:MAG: aminopeptidase [Candidatus Epulonipiscioides saccharophilum]|nr:MAG: aminopeptidase [Epulopiscium sp. AS2M-Bin001]
MEKNKGGTMLLKKEYKYAYLGYTAEDKSAMTEYAERYRQFISKNKTERECVESFISLAKGYGYRDLNDLIDSKTPLKAGDKVYANYMNKTLLTFCIGSESVSSGLNILGSHVDSPRLDLKPNPLYEDNKFAMFKTHYYGGVKKYQWVTLPLAMHGVVAKKDGSVMKICIGEDENDPVLGISDLLPHLSADQMEKRLREAIGGEDLNICAGTFPIDSKENKDSAENKDAVENKDKATTDKVKENILQILNTKYDITEEDLFSSEIELVPAGSARDYGLDRSMILGYGQDDRVCAYASFEAQMEVNNPKYTTCSIFVDKEEIGSYGASGMQSQFFENSVAEILELLGEFSNIKLRRVLANSRMLSSDVSAGYDPNFPSVLEKNNAPYLGKGVVLMKYTGSRGKVASNESNAEYVAKLRDLMEKNNVTWQTGELGKIDQGGGGTIAHILAKHGMDVIDCGVPVHSMHAPWEITSKVDLYEMKKAYVAFLKDA